MADTDVRSGIVLVLPAAHGDGNELVLQVEAAVRAAPIATVILERDPTTPIEPPELAALIEKIQALGIATLLSGDAAMARIVKADGVHLPASKTIAADYREARETLGSRFIAGADAGRTRHDAMTLGEEGADYVAFGIPAHVEDRGTARARRRELIGWWSEIFEPPCVAFDVDTPDEAGELAQAGADFVAVRRPGGVTSAGIAAFLAPFAAAIANAAPAA